MPELSYDIGGNPINSVPPLSPSTQTQSFLSPDQVQSRINILAPKNGADPGLATLIAKNESGFNPNAINPAPLKGGGHAQGVFQFTPDTAKRYGLDDPLNADKNIDAGTKFIGDLTKLYNGDKYKIAVHYNAGPSYVNKKFEELPEETQNYLTKLGIAGPSSSSSSQSTSASKNEQSYDLNGQPIRSISEIGKTRPGQVPNPLGYKATPQTSEQAANALNETMGNILPYALGGVGEIFGGPVGSAVGTGIGEGIKRPLTTGSNPSMQDIEDAVKGAAASYGTHLLLGTAPAFLKKYLKGRVVNKVEQAGANLEKTRQDIVGFPSGTNPQGESDELKAKLRPVKLAETSAWDKVNSRMDAAVSSFPDAKGTPQFVRGPMEISPDTINYINATRDQLKQLITLAPGNQRLVQAYASLDQASKALVNDAQSGKSYLPFDVAKQLRTNIGNVTSQEARLNLQAPGNSIGLSRGGGTLTALRDKLGNDVESSLAGMGPDALNEYGDAVGLTKSRVKASLIDKTLAKLTNYDTGQLDVTRAINAFKNPTSNLKGQFSGEETDAIVKTLNAIRSTSPDYNGALKYNAGKWLFYSAYGAAHPLSAVKTAIAFSTKDLFNAAMTQPRFARVLAQLPSAPANSSQARMLTRSFLKGAAKAIPAEIVTADGKRSPAHIDNDGTVKSDSQIAVAQ